MSLSAGREFLATPGPTTVPDRVLQAMNRPAADIWEGEAVVATDAVLSGVGRMFGASGPVYIYAANGHGAWEAALANVFSPGETVLVLESGNYAVSWGRTATAQGLNVTVLPGEPRGPVDPAAVEARLRADRTGEIKAVLVVQIDTASGVVNDVPAIRAAIDAAGHDALLLVDCIASLGCMPFDMDGWRVDLAVAASQKGLMAPPGLCYVAAGPRARAAHTTAALRVRYWDWSLREAEPHYAKYCGTPPVHLVFAQRAALEMIFDEGLAAVFARHRALARAAAAAVTAWAEGGALDFNVLAPAARSDALTTVLLADGLSSKPLRDYCRARLGVVLGIGLHVDAERKFRIAHMGHCNAPMLLGVVGSVEAALVALKIPHGGGLAEAARAVAEACPAAPADAVDLAAPA